MKIIGHRGAKGLAPENTIAGFRKALEYNADIVEFDVRVTKDNVAILHHDSKLTGPSGDKLRIENHTYQELRRHKSDLATLKEALDFIDGASNLYVEVKYRVNIEPIVQVLSDYKHAYALGSKNKQVLLNLHKALPKIPKIIIESWSGVRAVHRAKRFNTKLLSMNQHFLWFGFISAMNRRGYKLYVYTLNNPKKARRWAKYGLAGVVTDFPDRFKH